MKAVNALIAEELGVADPAGRAVEPRLDTPAPGDDVERQALVTGVRHARRVGSPAIDDEWARLAEANAAHGGP